MCEQLFFGSADFPYIYSTIQWTINLVLPTLAVPATKSYLVLGCDFWKELNICPKVWLEMIHTCQIMSEVQHERTDSQKADLLTVVEQWMVFSGKLTLQKQNSIPALPLYASKRNG